MLVTQYCNISSIEYSSDSTNPIVFNNCIFDVRIVYQIQEWQYYKIERLKSCIAGCRSELGIAKYRGGKNHQNWANKLRKPYDERYTDVNLSELASSDFCLVGQQFL